MKDKKIVSWYGCSSENNTCPIKNDCKRFFVVSKSNERNLDVSHTTLFEYACQENNNYQLFIQLDNCLKNEKNEDDSNSEKSDKTDDVKEN